MSDELDAPPNSSAIRADDCCFHCAEAETIVLLTARVDGCTTSELTGEVLSGTDDSTVATDSDDPVDSMVSMAAPFGHVAVLPDPACSTDDDIRCECVLSSTP